MDTIGTPGSRSSTATSSSSSSEQLFINPCDGLTVPSTPVSAITTPGEYTPGASTPSLFGEHDTVPPSHEHRSVVLCFDGTGDQFDTDNSNIVEFFSLLKKDNRNEQIVYYQAGIGTYTTPQIATPFFSNISKTMDMMIAWNLHAHLMDGYEFLMQNYQHGDKISIFGFSRGAYTARALAGMIHKVGLLPACNHQQVPFAYKMYTETDEQGWKQSTAFKKAFSVDVEIEFLGVWDTVCSVGLIPRTLPFTTSNTAVRYFRHALALDEHRAKFKHNAWNVPSPEEQQLGTQPGDMPKSTHRKKHRHHHSSSHHKSKEKDKEAKLHTKELEKRYSHHSLETDVLEVWFAGAHCDVGGGSVLNGTRHSLARIPLRWMIRQCFLCNTGIMFHADQLYSVGLDPTSLYPTIKERSPPITTIERPFAVKDYPKMMEKPFVNMGVIGFGIKLTVNEEEEDLYDALSPIYDQLAMNKGWWILELLPMKQRFQHDDHSWAAQFSVNMGKPRIIRKQHRQGLRVHRSVKIRMEAEGLEGGSYVPGPEFHVDPIWVD
ncbi:hypothetical protein JAAARDRAFT_157565 [Jaapia argillacea MUCL 33604]|uniref:T6SS Phospholipase effector Tle1-like catalytic domain-containing protein n=1 Tax=Jaapia argillacea MUCL 33604 TaxID=933084 RepID=A0A067PRF4_9AGAM|nr:hypothetical protein JAAARDRAFT_157565 [Jaapia argillacea MUCL 33604]